MGNKSRKPKGEKSRTRTVEGKELRRKWRQIRDVAGAGLPRANTGRTPLASAKQQWMGLKAKAVAPVVYETLPSGRKVKRRMATKLIYASTQYGPLRGSLRKEVR